MLTQKDIDIMNARSRFEQSYYNPSQPRPTEFLPKTPTPNPTVPTPATPSANIPKPPMNTPIGGGVGLQVATQLGVNMIGPWINKGTQEGSLVASDLIRGLTGRQPLTPSQKQWFRDNPGKPATPDNGFPPNTFNPPGSPGSPGSPNGTSPYNSNNPATPPGSPGNRHPNLPPNLPINPPNPNKPNTNAPNAVNPSTPASPNDGLGDDGFDYNFPNPIQSPASFIITAVGTLQALDVVSSNPWVRLAPGSTRTFEINSAPILGIPTGFLFQKINTRQLDLNGDPAITENMTVWDVRVFLKYKTSNEASVQTVQVAVFATQSREVAKTARAQITYVSPTYPDRIDQGVPTSPSSGAGAPPTVAPPMAPPSPSPQPSNPPKKDDPKVAPPPFPFMPPFPFVNPTGNPFSNPNPHPNLNPPPSPSPGNPPTGAPNPGQPKPQNPWEPGGWQPNLKVNNPNEFEFRPGDRRQPISTMKDITAPTSSPSKSTQAPPVTGFQPSTPNDPLVRNPVDNQGNLRNGVGDELEEKKAPVAIPNQVTAPVCQDSCIADLQRNNQNNNQMVEIAVNRFTIWNRLSGAVFVPERVSVPANMVGFATMMGNRTADLRARFGRHEIVQRLQGFMNAITTITVIHNAAMLSRSLAETLGDLTTNAIQTFAPFFGIPDETAQQFDLNEVLGKQVDEFMKNLLTPDVWNGTKENWTKANRIISTATNIVWTVRSIGDSTQQIAEWTAENTGRIGNALKRFRVVGENAYSWMPERVTGQSAFRNRLQRFLDGQENIENAASSLNSTISEVRSAREEFNELKEQRENFNKAVKDAFPNSRPDNDATKDAAQASNNASKSPALTLSDRQKGETE